MARAQSRTDQLRMMEYVCSKLSNVKFRYWDSPANGKKLKLDGVEHISYYRDLGKKMAEAPLISYN